MTVLMTLFGMIVFVFSTFTVGFKSAWKRLMTFAVSGLIIDVFIVIVAFAYMYFVHF